MYRLAAHLVYWGKALIIHVMATANVYAIHPNLDMCRVLAISSSSSYPAHTAKDIVNRPSPDQSARPHHPSSSSSMSSHSKHVAPNSSHLPLPDLLTESAVERPLALAFNQLLLHPILSTKAILDLFCEFSVLRSLGEHVRRAVEQPQGPLTLPLALSSQSEGPLALALPLSSADVHADFIDKTQWLLQHRMLHHLHTYVYLLPLPLPSPLPRPDPRPFPSLLPLPTSHHHHHHPNAFNRPKLAEERRCSGQGNIHSQGTGEASSVEEGGGVQHLFKRLSPLFQGRHHLDEIMWRENMSRSALQAVLDAYSSVLVLCCRP
mmetsp:Transcript_28583/g.46304  ORF Transcript_28583/g.46304 Transcript_28583/m.46304 type:complete len:320 (-) Transcript_28583:265-1224(-)